MNDRMLIVAMVLISLRLVVPCASAQPKAYDAVFYKGKEAGLKIVFEFDHGYLEASNVKITESASGKTTKFYLSGRDGRMGTGKIRFAAVTGAKKEVLLELDPFADSVSTVKGSYTTAGKTVSFTLRKRKKHRTAQLPYDSDHFVTGCDQSTRPSCHLFRKTAFMKAELDGKLPSNSGYSLL